MSKPRALLSVYDRTGLAEFAAGLAELGWELVASGGTGSALSAAGIRWVSVEEVTGSPEMLDGRVKTLHPAIHGGLLARRDRPEHMRELRAHAIAPIHLVASNLYPFAATLAQSGNRDAIIENIDIGGPTLERAAAKNHAHVWIIVDPGDYPRVLAALRAEADGAELRRELAAKAFALTAFYDAHVAGYLQAELAKDFPNLLTIPLRKKQDLRYGENPHQRGAFYAAGASELGEGGLAGIEQLHGRELSYVNILDLQSAWAAANDFVAPAAAIVKHTTPCGLSVHPDSQQEAYAKAHAGDPMSAYGGIVGFNRPVEEATVAAMKGHHYDVLVAPDFAPAALRRLRRRKNLRIIRWPAEQERSLLRFESAQAWGLGGGFLVQDPDRSPDAALEMLTASKAIPTDGDLEQLRFGLSVIRHVKSNAIVLVRDHMLVGVGAGQVNRVNAVRQAVEQAGAKARGSYLASDALFPFADGPEAALRAGVRAMVSVAGALREAEVIETVDRYGGILALVDERHFKH